MLIPPRDLRKRFHTDYNDRSIFAANARLLQSIWREEKGIPFVERYGNYIEKEQAQRQGLNFLSPKIASIVKTELQENDRMKGPSKKVLKRDRLYENMLASQPLAQVRHNSTKSVDYVFKTIKEIKSFDYKNGFFISSRDGT